MGIINVLLVWLAGMTIELGALILCIVTLLITVFRWVKYGMLRLIGLTIKATNNPFLKAWYNDRVYNLITAEKDKFDIFKSCIITKE